MSQPHPYSKYSHSPLFATKNSPTNHNAYSGFRRDGEEHYYTNTRSRPYLNQDHHQEYKPPSSKAFARKYNHEPRYQPSYPDNTDADSKYNYSNRRFPSNHHYEEDNYRGKDTGLYDKYRPSSNERPYEREEYERNAVLKNSHSQGQLLRRNYNKDEEAKPVPPRQLGKKVLDHGQKPELSEYKKLYDKLDSLESKLAAMKVNLEKKKTEKEMAIQLSQKEKRQREDQKEKKSQQKSQSKLEKPESKQKSENILKGIVTQMPKVNKELHNFDYNPYSPRHNMYYVSEITRAYKEDKSLAREHLLTSMQLLKIMNGSKRMSAEEMSAKVLNLPKKSYYKDKKTVVFDLDETLIHCNQSTSIPHDVALPITFPTGEVIEAGINIRPHAQEVLKALAANFEVIIFTASHSCYANVVLDHLDPEKNIIQHRLYREHCCVTSEGMHVKDLRVINRKETDMVLIDNAAYSYAFQLQNGIPMIPYYEGKNDFELRALQTYLQRLIWVPDVREVNRKVFKLEEYRNFEDPESLVQELYSEWIA